jgi:predicted hydrocarbon binding protein
VVETLTDKKVARKLSTACDVGGKQPTTGLQKAKLVKCLIDQLSKNVNRKFAFMTMEACGRSCIAKSTIKTAKKLRKESKNLDEFLAKLNEKGIGGGHLKRRRKQIHARYDRCYCGWVSKTKEPIPLTYCFCSAGWYKELFETALGKTVNVTLLQSIINGAKSCRFIIDIQDSPVP